MKLSTASDRRAIGRATVEARRRQRRRLRPSLLALEDRQLLSTFTVTSTLDDGSDGTLRWAIAQANSGGDNTIDFDAGVFATPQTITLNGNQLELSDTSGTETITGPAAGVTVNGNNANGVFQVDRGVTASISNLTITGGNSFFAAGGLYNQGTITLTGCTFSDNTGFFAPGALYNDGTATLTDCAITGSTATFSNGGVTSFGTITMTRCSFTGNSGGLYLNNGTVTLTDCTVSGNGRTGVHMRRAVSATVTGCTISGSSGDGLYIGYGPATVTDCTVSGNSGTGVVDRGRGSSVGRATLTNCTISGNSHGGLDNGYSTFATLTNCTISGNSSGDNGGGVYNDGNATLTGCTISGNSSGRNGGGLATSNYGATTLSNTIIAGNTAGTGPDVAGVVASPGNNLIGEADGSSGWVGTDLTGTVAAPLNPVLAPLGDYGGPTRTMALLPGSPAIGAGSNALIPDGVTTDQRGLPRVVDGVVDIGAFESSGFTLAYTSGSGQTAGAVFPAPLVATVTANNPDEPVAGGLVTFTPPDSGASAVLDSPAAIGVGGTVSVTAANNGLAGSYTVTATANGAPGVLSYSLTNLAMVSIALSPGNPELALGVVGQLTAIGTFADGSTGDVTRLVTDWESATPSVATISGTGVASALSLGTTAITASMVGITSTADILTVIAPSFVVNTTADDFDFYSGTTSLREAIAGANALPGQTITFDPTVFAGGQTITLTRGQLELSGASGTEAITGPDGGVTVDAHGASRVFQVDGGVTATISGMTITGGSAQNGGGLANYGGNLTLTSCTVSGNSAGNNGGGVYSNTGGTTTLADCTVGDNSATVNGAGIYVNGGGSASLTDCTITGNTGLQGAVFNSGSTVSLTDCTASGNTAGYGAGVYTNNGGTTTLTNCTVSGNTASGNGGGVYTKDATTTLMDSIVSGNSAGGYGGGLYSQNAATTLTNCTVGGNSSSSGGGLFINSGTLTLTDSMVSDNSVGGGISGGIWIRGDNTTATLAGCTISGNYAGNSGGGLYIDGGNTATLAGCTFTDNLGGNAGGGVCNMGTAMLDTCTFTNNLANQGVGGGLANFGTATLTNCTVSGNTDIYRGGGGVGNFGMLTLTNCTVSDNVGIYCDGGGLFNYSGPGVYNSQGTMTLTNCTVSGNSASVNGGGVFSQGTTTLTDCTVSGNSAGNNGGGLFNNHGATSLTDCTVSGNSASHSGGGLADFGTATLTSCTVSGNSADNGGGVYLNFGGSATLTNCLVSRNSASVGPYSNGGGVDIHGGGTVTLTNCTITGNTGVAGAGMINQFSTAILTDCTISDNSASADGLPWSFAGNAGGLSNFAGTTTLTNCTFSGNSASKTGGGLYASNGATTTLTNCTVSGNSADNGGGLASDFDTTIMLGNTIVAGNMAGTGPDVSGVVTSLGNNLIGETDGSSGWVGTDLTGTVVTPLNPLLAPLGDYGGPTQTMALLPGSPAIDAGSNALIPDGVTTDQRGLPRVVNSVVDIGAFESSGFTIAVTSGSGQSTGVLTAFPNPLVATVTANNPDEPVAGGLVTFTPPSSGASATLSGSPATVGGDGSASVTATANGVTGSYAVTATASGITTPASFRLTNLQLIIALDPSASGALSLSGNASINTAGIVYINSSSSSALTASGNANVTAQAIDVHGRFVRSGNAGLNPTPVAGAPVLAVASLPLPSAAGMTNHGSLSLGGNSSTTIQPGIYTRISVTGNARLTMAPGIYIIEGGGFSASGFSSVSGSGVMIVNAGSNYPAAGGSYGGISLGGNATFNLSPASSGIYAGIVLFQPSDNTKAMSVTTNASGIAGTIYAPAVTLSESGNAALNASLIVKRLSLSGNGAANGPRAAGCATAGIRSNAVAASVKIAATSSSIGAVSVLEQAAPATIPTRMKVKLTDALGNNVGASRLPVVSMAATSAGDFVPQALPVGSPMDNLVTINPTTVTSRFSLKSKGSRLFA
ncbi:putative outer membrane protein pmp20 precursor [Aquisphaera giovannonii]|uniref:Putative outer membrane protein pmp20 n=1 Tax=Aquisphaera giovannonii TaxID=406548 RepID=A0A5B9W3Z6_9BACT|nr:right-handed parallel beta-helix repeat-containing protein [Aquisphaera giovannonii]QEH34974.1 putative outer membrane protein pmp20 precursor [Aquisphaera giovannonii]